MRIMRRFWARLTGKVTMSSTLKVEVRFVIYAGDSERNMTITHKISVEPGQVTCNSKARFGSLNASLAERFWDTLVLMGYLENDKTKGGK